LGLRFGHRRLAPAISPKKSVEGAVAGLIAAALIAAVIMPELGYSPWYGGCLGLLISIAAQAGDLVESGLKRYCGVKDSGNIIPGHGGFLDRFDALLFAGPFVYYFAVLMMG
jgi:phosphatidate cytidylyltransferase